MKRQIESLDNLLHNTRDRTWLPGLSFLGAIHEYSLNFLKVSHKNTPAFSYFLNSPLHLSLPAAFKLILPFQNPQHISFVKVNYSSILK